MTVSAEVARATWSPYLTQRERQVLALSIQGLSVNEMAGELSLSRHTVKTHLGRMYRRLGVRTRAEAIGVAVAAEMVTAGQVQVPSKVQAFAAGQGRRVPLGDDGVARRVALSDPTLPISHILQVVKVLRRLGMLDDRA